MKKIITLILIALSTTYTIKAQTIFSSVFGSACEGANFNITLNVSGAIINPGNIYTVQLSDSAGTFNSPTILANIPSTNMNDTLVCTLPNNLTASSYQIRINSSDTAIVGTPTTINVIQKPEVNAGTDIYACGAVASVNLNGSFVNAGGIIWTTMGGGSFISSTSPSTVYNPSAADYVVGSVALILTSTGSSCGTAKDTLNVVFTTPPSISFLGPSLTVCEGNQVTIDPVVSNVTQYSWSTGNNTSIVSFVASSSFTLSVMGQNPFGCIDSALINIFVQPKPNISFSSITHTTCGNSNGAIFINVPPTVSSIWWQYNGSSADSLVNLPAGGYLVQVTDTNNCTNSAIATINNTNGPSISVSTTPTSCPSKCNATAILGISGGVAPYTIQWSNNVGGNVSSVSNLCTGNYTVSVTDAASCVSSTAYSITSSGNDPLISGNVTIAGAPIMSGVVELYRFNATSLALSLINTASINSAGNYSVASFTEGDYLIAATANNTTYPNAIKTYFVQENNWSDATTVNAGCNLTTVKDISVINLAPLTGGNDTITGVIYNVLGGKTNTVGDPIPGIDVSLEQNPGSIMVAQTTTDGDGKYNFDDVPAGNYSLYVDIPGLGMVSSHNVATGSGTEHADLNFYVDSATGISKTPPPSTVGIQKASKVLSNSVRVYPNPFTSELSVAVELKSNSTVAFEVRNIMGEKIMETEKTNRTSGNYKMEIPNSKNLSSGIYILTTTINDQKTVTRIVKQ